MEDEEELAPNAERMDETSNPDSFEETADTNLEMMTGNKPVAVLVTEEDKPNLPATCEEKICDANFVIGLVDADEEFDNKDII